MFDFLGKCCITKLDYIFNTFYLLQNLTERILTMPVRKSLDSGSEVCGFDPGRGQWIFSEHKNPEYDFLRKGSKAVGPVK